MGRLIGLVLVAASVAVGACASDAPADGVSVALRIEKVRAHLLAADANATAWRWSLAAVHAAHPAEDLQPIDSALSKRDAKADATLRRLLIDVRQTIAMHPVDGVGPRDEAVAAAIAAADASLAAAERAILGEGFATPAFRAALAAHLLELSATEYAESVTEGAVREESEYQDAFAFFARAQALVAGADLDVAMAGHAAMAQLAGALPGIAAPTAPLSAERFEALTGEARVALLAVAGPALGAGRSDVAALLTDLDAASAALASGDAHRAAEALTTFRGTWTQAEGTVKTRSPDAYARVEHDLAIAVASVDARAVDATSARGAIERMRAQLSPLVSSATPYGVVDAAVILVREGVEALLVVAALLSFLAKTGNAEKQRWIWAGGAAGVLASIAIAFAITVAFSAGTRAGADREVLEGVTGLFAAAMLIYMSWWLHTKASLASWQRYVREKSGAALARNSLLGLSLIAFLAVFREGAETTLFYVGMAPSIALGDLVAGLAIASFALAAIGVLVLAFGMRIPIRPFFLGTSVLVYYLAFKFVGTGIHALQVAGAAPASPRNYLPDIGAIGAFSTVETTIVQSAMLALAIAWLLRHRVARLVSVSRARS